MSRDPAARRLRVLLVTPMYPTPSNPGFGAFIERQVRVLRELAVDITVASCGRGRSRQQLIVRYGKLVVSTAQQALGQFDLVHVHYPTVAGVIGGLAARARRKPLVITLHGGELDEVQLGELSPVRRRLTIGSAILSLRWADAVVVVGPHLAALVASAGIAPEKVSVVDMGVDCEVFRPIPKEKARGILGLPTGVPLILFVGWFIPLKGPQYFIRAAGILRSEFPESLWALVGSGPLESELGAAAALAIGDRAVFAGQRTLEEVALWDAAADVVVMPSLAEQFGLAGLEAGACGTPVVASDVGGVRGFLQDGVNGLLVRPGDADGLASAIRTLITDVELRGRMGRSGVAVASQHELRLQAAKVLGIYRRLVPE